MSLSPSLSKKQATLGKTQLKHFHNNVHLCTADTAITIRIKPYKERGNSAIYPYSPADARVPTKTNFQYKLTNARQSVYLLIFLVASSEIWNTDPGRLHHSMPSQTIYSGSFPVLFYHLRQDHPTGLLPSCSTLQRHMHLSSSHTCNIPHPPNSSPEIYVRSA